MIKMKTVGMGCVAAALAVAGIGGAIAYDGKVKVVTPQAEVKTHARDVHVEAPRTKVDVDGDKVAVDAPYTHVKRSKKGVHVVAPYVNIWVPTR